MISLIYVSSSVGLYTAQDVAQILEESDLNNTRLQVTGLLAYQNGNIMQVLEGPKEAVMETFGRIKADPRHRNISVLLIEEIDQRHFSDWKMAFVDLGADKFQLDSRFSPFLQESLLADKFRAAPGIAKAMLVSFKDALE